MSYQNDRKYPEAYPPPGYRYPPATAPPPGYPYPPPPPPGYQAPPDQGHCCHHDHPSYGYQQSYQGYFNQGYPPSQEYPPNRQDGQSSGCLSFLQGCLGALCCCCVLEECCLLEELFRGW
eukprot:TRINITY_DN251_c0_g1_i1.p1 TRINITY_DN251_c0_g1~~TRINITY_DN251_c0_g1_i1.p1  ORF type:complete len:120 (-),score=18.38 TRINITY_DN251_c0_g1_i1:358-717(-)